jgi:hypothetical protein
MEKKASASARSLSITTPFSTNSIESEHSLLEFLLKNSDTGAANSDLSGC